MDTTSSKLSSNSYKELLVQYLFPLWRGATLLAFLLFGDISLKLILPQIMRLFIDTVQVGGSMDALYQAAVLFLILALVQQVVAVLSVYIGENVSWKATNNLRIDLAAHCLRLDLSFHNTHTPGEMIERIDGDVTTLSNFFSRFIIKVLGNAFLLAGILILLFREDWRVGLAMTLFAGVTLGILGRFRNLSIPYWGAERQASAELFGFLEERLGGTEDIRANGASDYVMQSFHRLMRELLQRTLRAGMIINLLYNASIFLFSVGVAVAFAVGAYLFESRVISIGTVYLIYQYTFMLSRPIEEITRQMEDFQRAGASIVRVRELLSLKSRIQSTPSAHIREVEVKECSFAGEKHKAHSSPLAITFENVSFGYHDDEPYMETSNVKSDKNISDSIDDSEDRLVDDSLRLHATVLHDLSFSLPPKSILGLLGRTGSGKTSIIRLIFRLFDPDEGGIRIAPSLNDELTEPICDIRDLPIEDLRRRIGIVTQKVQLFNASVRDNLTFFDREVTDDSLEIAIHKLGLEGWFQALPKGFDTVLDSGGGGLSAGEAQLLAFTRIFLKDPGLVILDEASSRLDPATEQLIDDAVERLIANRTAIIVAHRLSTVKRANRIMILEGGRILEFGKRSELQENPSTHFHQLLKSGLEKVLA